MAAERDRGNRIIDNLLCVYRVINSHLTMRDPSGCPPRRPLSPECTAGGAAYSLPVFIRSAGWSRPPAQGRPLPIWFRRSRARGAAAAQLQRRHPGIRHGCYDCRGGALRISSTGLLPKQKPAAFAQSHSACRSRRSAAPSASRPGASRHHGVGRRGVGKSLKTGYISGFQRLRRMSSQLTPHSAEICISS